MIEIGTIYGEEMLVRIAPVGMQMEFTHTVHVVVDVDDDVDIF